MDHASFIIGSWILTGATVVAYAAWVVKRGRDLSSGVDPEDLPWT